MCQIPPFSNNNAILACTLNFCPSLIWLSIVGLLLAITVYIISSIKILVALAKDYLHRCCYGQYRSRLFPYYLATTLPAYKLRRRTAYLNIMQGYSESWAWLIWTQWLCAMSLWAARLHWFYWIFQAPFLICIPSLLVESVQGSGKSLVIYQENSMCFFFLGPSSWNVYAMDQVEANIFQCTSYKSRLVL